MARTPSTQMLDLGSPMPAFSLPNVDGKTISSLEFSSAPVVVVMFICNHCPFVKHLDEGITSLTREYQAKGVEFIAISSNDVDSHPSDSPEKMREEAGRLGYTFPYLFDADQSVAKAFFASCTPDFYVFSKGNGLTYRGQFDDSQPVKEGTALPVTGSDLRRAIDAALEGRSPDAPQKPSIGCNIKWIPGNEPEYATALST